MSRASSFDSDSPFKQSLSRRLREKESEANSLRLAIEHNFSRDKGCQFSPDGTPQDQEKLRVLREECAKLRAQIERAPSPPASERYSSETSSSRDPNHTPPRPPRWNAGNPPSGNASTPGSHGSPDRALSFSALKRPRPPPQPLIPPNTLRYNRVPKSPVKNVPQDVIAHRSPSLPNLGQSRPQQKPSTPTANSPPNSAKSTRQRAASKTKPGPASVEPSREVQSEKRNRHSDASPQDKSYPKGRGRKRTNPSPRSASPEVDQSPTTRLAVAKKGNRTPNWHASSESRPRYTGTTDVHFELRKQGLVKTLDGCREVLNGGSPIKDSKFYDRVAAKLKELEAILKQQN